MTPSRQERRKAERDASKRAPAKSGAGGAAGAGGAEGAAAALANLNVNPLGDWTTQAEDPYVGSGQILPCSPRHRLSINSRDEGSKGGHLRRERYVPGPTHRRCLKRSEPRS